MRGLFEWVVSLTKAADQTRLEDGVESIMKTILGDKSRAAIDDISYRSFRDNLSEWQINHTYDLSGLRQDERIKQTWEDIVTGIEQAAIAVPAVQSGQNTSSAQRLRSAARQCRTLLESGNRTLSTETPLKVGTICPVPNHLLGLMLARQSQNDLGVVTGLNSAGVVSRPYVRGNNPGL